MKRKCLPFLRFIDEHAELPAWSEKFFQQLLEEQRQLKARGTITGVIFDDFVEFNEEHLKLFQEQGMGEITRFQLIEHKQEPRVKQGRHYKRPVQKNRGPIKRKEWN